MADPCFVKPTSQPPEWSKPSRRCPGRCSGIPATAQAVEAAITARTRALPSLRPITPPGQPSTLTSRPASQRLQPRSMTFVVISDEIYDRLAYGVEQICFASLPGMRDRTIVLQGFSKSYAMTGWRVGYMMAPTVLASEIRKLHQYLIMSAPTASQWAALKALEIGEPFVEMMRAEYDRRRRLIVTGLNNLGLTCVEPRGAFYASRRFRSRDG